MFDFLCPKPHLNPVETAMVRLIDNPSLTVEAKDIIANTARPPWFCLVFVS